MMMLLANRRCLSAVNAYRARTSTSNGGYLQSIVLLAIRRHVGRLSLVEQGLSLFYHLTLALSLSLNKSVVSTLLNDVVSLSDLSACLAQLLAVDLASDSSSSSSSSNSSKTKQEDELIQVRGCMRWTLLSIINVTSAAALALSKDEGITTGNK